MSENLNYNISYTEILNFGINFCSRITLNCEIQFLYKYKKIGAKKVKTLCK